MRLILVSLLLLAACGRSYTDDEAGTGPDLSPPGALNGAAPPEPENAAELPPLDPPGPGEPGGLPDDRTPLSEAPFTEESAQGAANVVQTYYALIESGRHREAWRLWSDGGEASGMNAEAFAASFGGYREYHANIGGPGEMEGAAGSAYVEIPVQIYGRLRNGEPFNRRGSVRLRRCNDVPGCTEEQRKWRIVDSDVRPRPE
ncbi:hypothetical protein [Sphingosinicella sp. CPCC 101087]|uniref:hypothetical protein n=1 Tax=Sphingosinicella sp. CPCC 101087 TaxID=2497754 RepID=UPI00101BF7FE|nr:hypothetical protein [Sphingosinicella sp. CPCC 101087]